jgi:putative ABC transport system substrate-binding protein
MARPAGNITGISGWGGEMISKRLQLLRELVPAGRSFGILIHPPAVTAPLPTDRWEKGINAKLRVYESNGPADMVGVFAAMARDRIDGLLVLGDGNSYSHRERLNALCLQHRLPSVWGGRDFLTGGALASYQSDFPEMFRRAATLVDAILKGRAPGEIPFEQATKLELVIDKRAARALGVAVPATMLVAADHVID